MTKSALTLGIVALVSIPMAAQASLLTGVLGITGTVNITLGSIDFVGNSFTVNPAVAETGGFVALAGTTGTIDNITNPPDATGVALDQPSFMTFAAAPNITFTLTLLKAGIDGSAGCTASVPAAGQVCTPDVPAESPYNLQNTSASSSSASFDIVLTEVDSSPGGQTISVTGAFSQPFTTSTFQLLEAEVQGGLTVTTPFSAQFATASGTPEPSSLLELMMGMGLVGISIVYRKKLKRT
jgi:hypothetical protein